MVALRSALTRNATESVIAAGYRFVHRPIAVVIDAIADFIRQSATHTARIPHCLVDHAITVIVLTITRFVCGTDDGPTFDRPTSITNRCADSTNAGYGGRAGVGHYDRFAVCPAVGQPIAIIIDPIAHLRSAIRDAEVAITEIAGPIAVTVHLVSISDLGAVVARVTQAIFVFIELVRVKNIRAVIFQAEPIFIRVEADALGPFERQQREQEVKGISAAKPGLLPMT